MRILMVEDEPPPRDALVAASVATTGVMAAPTTTMSITSTRNAEGARRIRRVRCIQQPPETHRTSVTKSPGCESRYSRPNGAAAWSLRDAPSHGYRKKVAAAPL